MQDLLPEIHNLLPEIHDLLFALYKWNSDSDSLILYIQFVTISVTSFCYLILCKFFILNCCKLNVMYYVVYFYIVGVCVYINTIW